MKNLKLQIKVLLILFTCSGLLYGAVTLQYFTARDNASGVFVEWKTGDEESTSRFELERSADTPDNFIYINFKNATGNNSYYSYQDNSVDFGRTSSIYYYRLKCIEGSGNYTYTNHITVSHTVSGIRSTWGSIKAIFR
ncbi:MAG: hypothetical protein ABIY50_05445 [Ignavibacteria bacterium]